MTRSRLLHPNELRGRIPGSWIALHGLKILVFLAATLVSLLWWRADANLCDCEWCPDGYCLYADAIHAGLSGSDAALARLAKFGVEFTHAHSPLAPTVMALLPMQAGLSALPAFALTSLACTVLAWVALRRGVSLEWGADARVGALAFVAFFSNVIVVRSMARPLTDALGLACTAWSIYLLQVRLAEPSAGSAAGLFASQLLGLFSRVSFIPMLGLPALARMWADPREGLADRIRSAIRDGLVFGALPGVVFIAICRSLDIEHIREAWEFAHRPAFVESFTLETFQHSMKAAGGVLLVMGPLGAAFGGWQRPAWRLHASWVALYLAFLLSGRGSLWFRYFLPLVPSIVFLALPVFVWIARRGLAAAIASTLIIALPGLLSANAGVPRIRSPLAMLLASAPFVGSSGSEASNLHPVAKDQLTVTREARADGTSVDLLHLTASRRVRGIGFGLVTGTLPSSLSIEGSADGDIWTPLGDRLRTVERPDFFAPEPRIVVRIRPSGRLRSLRLRWSEGPAPPEGSVMLYVPTRAPHARRAAAPRRQVETPAGEFGS